MNQHHQTRRPLALSLLVFLLWACTGCGLCSLMGAIGISNPYGGVAVGWTSLIEGLQKGILSIDEAGLVITLIGSFFLSIASIITFIFVFRGLQKGLITQKAMLISYFLCFALIFLCIGSYIMVRGPYCQRDYPEGNSESVTCALQLR